MIRDLVVLNVFGTRPEAIKMAPLVKRLETAEHIHSKVCVTAQHRQMLDSVLQQYGIHPDYDLNLMKAGQTLTAITTGVLEGMAEVLKECKPDIVLVHGDTTTSMATALAAFYQRIPVGHVEAGLRSHHLYSPFPEELNRILTGHIAALHFAPTERSRQNLLREGVTHGVHVVGNTIVDTLQDVGRESYLFRNPEVRSLPLEIGRWVLVTAHRRENIGRPLRQICRALSRLAQKYPDIRIVYPMHPNPEVRKTVCEILGHQERIYLIEPIEAEDMHNLIWRSYMVMTDSGGLQEESPALGKPVVVLRTETERPEVIESGVAILAGVEEDSVFQAGDRLLCDKELYRRMSHALSPYGDGHASERIVAVLQDYASRLKD